MRGVAPQYKGRRKHVTIRWSALAEQQAPPRVEVRNIIPVVSQGFHTWLETARRATVFDHKALEDVPYRDLAHAARIADAALTPWLAGSGYVAAVADPEAFKKSVLRKVVGIAESIRLLILTELRGCGDAIRGLEEAVARGEPVRPDEQLYKNIEECTKAIMHADNALLALLIAANKLDGIVQSNLPPELQPATTQAPMGFVMSGGGPGGR